MVNTNENTVIINYIYVYCADKVYNIEKFRSRVRRSSIEKRKNLLRRALGALTQSMQLHRIVMKLLNYFFVAYIIIGEFILVHAKSRACATALSTMLRKTSLSYGGT
jgi:hypothetical protein